MTTTSDERLVEALRDFAASESGQITDDYLAAEVEVERLARELSEAKARRDRLAAVWGEFWLKWNGPGYTPGDHGLGAPSWGGIEQYQAEGR